MKKISLLFCLLIVFASMMHAANYPHYVLALTETTGIENNPDYLDLRPNDVDRHMYLWESTLTGTTETDSPFEGAYYSKFVVKNGWCGLGFINDQPIDFATFAHNDFILHFAIKTTATCPLFLKLESGGYPGYGRVNLTGKYAIPRDGEWHRIEIPMTAFYASGLRWKGNLSGKNFFTLISESSTSGQEISLDAIYFHCGTRLDGTTYTPDIPGEISPSYPSYYYVASETGLDGNNVVDLRPNDMTRFLYVWENTAAAAPATGEAYEGGQFSNLKTSATMTWFGFGVVSESPVDFTPFTKQKYTLQFALKTTSLMPLFVKLEGLNNSSAICYLSGEYDFRRDGKWHLIQIPMDVFLNQGLDWNGSITKNNYFTLISEKTEKNAEIAFDAIRFKAGDPEVITEDPLTPPEVLPEKIIVATETTNIENDTRFLDLRPNDTDKFMYVWENTATGIAQDGPAFEGAQYPNLKINSTWFGFGFTNITPVDFSCFAFKDYILHFALKTTAIMPMFVLLEGRGEAQVNLNGNYALPRDGQWHEINIPMSEFFNQGLIWDAPMANKNYFSLVSQLSVPGTTIAFDDIYFYQDPNSAVRNTVEDKLQLILRGSILHIQNVDNHLINIYNMQGISLYKGVSGEISIARFPAGIYIAKVGDMTKKFIIK